MPAHGVYGEQRWGGLAEYTVAPAANLRRLPEDIDDATAAAMQAAYTTAYRMLRAGGCRLGAHVLVIGAGGGVATAALLLARTAGASVYVTSGHAWKLERAAALGATAGFDSSSDAIEQWAWEATAGHGMDLVIDSVGAATSRQSIRSLAMGGSVAICGATSGDRPDISIRELYQRHGRIVGAPLGGRRSVRLRPRLGARRLAGDSPRGGRHPPARRRRGGVRAARVRRAVRQGDRDAVGAMVGSRGEQSGEQIERN